MNRWFRTSARQPSRETAYGVDPSPKLRNSPIASVRYTLAPVEIAPFIQKWSASVAAERANKDSFLHDLCDVRRVPHPQPKTNDPDRDLYVFERDILLPHEGETTFHQERGIP